MLIRASVPLLITDGRDNQRLKWMNYFIMCAFCTELPYRESALLLLHFNALIWPLLRPNPQRHWVPSGVWKVFAHCHHNRSSTITAIIIITITCLGKHCHARYHKSNKVQSDLFHKFKQFTLSICFEWLVDQIAAVGQLQSIKKI